MWWWLASAFAGGPESVEVCAVDEAGEPIATATVRSPIEAERSRVNRGSGCWLGSVLYLPDGTERQFLPGSTFAFDVAAPGRVTRRVEVNVQSSRRANRVTVTLAPLPDLRQAEGALAARTAEQLDRWSRLEAEFVADPTAPRPADLTGARRAVAELASTWILWARETGADPALAVQVCRSASDRPDDCGA